LFSPQKSSKRFLSLNQYNRNLHSGKLTNENKEEIYNGKATMIFVINDDFNNYVD